MISLHKIFSHIPRSVYTGFIAWCVLDTFDIPYVSGGGRAQILSSGAPYHLTYEWLIHTTFMSVCVCVKLLMCVIV